MFYQDGFFMGGMHGGWWIFWLVLIVILVIYLRNRDGEGGAARETPRESLRRRLAGGKITPEQYEERKALLDRDETG